MHRPFVLVAIVTALGASTTAHADDGVGCSEAVDDSQVKRDDAKLLEARQLLRTCSGPSCSATVQKVCSDLLADVDARVPSFVLSARDGSGADRVDVKVTMDGRLVVSKLDGRAIEVDPGPHSFIFELPGGTRAETTAVADERIKGKIIAVTLDTAPKAPTPSAAPSPPQPARAPSQTGGSPLATIGLVAGAAGIAGLVLGTVTGVLALSTKSSYCPNGMCEPGHPASTIHTEETISTVGFVAGGILLAGGATLFLVAPKGNAERVGAKLAVGPLVSSSGGGFQFLGQW
jgi:hypothetical protein